MTELSVNYPFNVLFEAWKCRWFLQFGQNHSSKHLVFLLILEQQCWGGENYEWTITFISKSDSQPRDSWIRHVRWNVAWTVSQMRQRLRHRGPAVPKSITPTMEQCTGNAQCLTMDTNCWLTWKLSSVLIYNLTSKVHQWLLCVCTVKLNMTTGHWEQIWASTIVVVLACMQAHHARIKNTLLMNSKNNYTNVTALLKTSFGCQKLVQQDFRFMSEKFWRGGLTLSRFSSLVTKALRKQPVCWHAFLITGTLEHSCWFCLTISVAHLQSESTRNEKQDDCFQAV